MQPNFITNFPAKTRLLAFLIAVMASLNLGIVYAQSSPEMNKSFAATDFQFKGWDNVAIPASYFLPNAVEIRIGVEGASYIAFQVNNTDYKEFSWSDANIPGISYTLDATSKAAALAGTLMVRTNINDCNLYILNLDAQGLEDEQNNPGTGGTGGGATTMTLEQKIAARRQITNLPTVYLTVPDALDADGNRIEINNVLYKQNNVAEYHAATIQVVDESDSSTPNRIGSFTENSLQIKVRGNSTADDGKKPYRLKFGKDEKDANGNVIKSHKHDMTGNGYAKRNWTLLTNHKDASLVHNALTYYVGQAVGMPFCPGYKFVDLVINNEYRGNYMLSDHCEVGSHRIEVDEDTGWFIESAPSRMVEDPSVNAGGLFMSIKNPDTDNYTEAQITALKKEVSDYFTKINYYMGVWSTPCSDEEFRDPVNGWRKYFDEESLVRFYIGINLTGDYDGFMTVKMYREADGKMQFGPLWDKDLAYGNWSADDGTKLCEVQQANSNLFSDYMQCIMTDPVFIKKVHDRYHEIINLGYLKNMKEKIDMLGELVTESQALNYKKWWTGSDYPAEIAKLKDYFDIRVSNLTSTWDKMYKAAGGDAIQLPETPTHHQLTNLPTIYLTAASVGNDWTAVGLECYDSQNKLSQGTEWTNTAVSVQYQGSGGKDSKDSYRLKFENKIKLLGSTKYKQWVLLSNDDDPSLMRNALAKTLGDQLGLPFTPGYQFVDLYLNDKYLGTYQVTDRVKVESGRAMVAGGNKDDDWHIRFNSDGEIAEDNLTTDEYIAGSKYMPNIIAKNPDPDELTAAELTALNTAMKTYFQQVFTVDDKGNFTQFADNVDQQQLIAWYISQEVLCIYKGFDSVEAYRSITSTATDQKLHMAVIWDSEKSLGNNSTKHPVTMDDLETPYSNEYLMTEYADYKMMKRLFRNLWRQSWFASGVLSLWNTKRATLLTQLKSQANSLQTELSQSQVENQKVWGLETYQTYAAAVSAISTFLDARFEYLDVKFTALAKRGDLNDDGKWDVLDVNLMRDILLQKATDTYSRADINADGELTIEDLPELIEMVK